MKGKKVIFVGGTAYSGSTLLDMILANDPVGFSCGEIQAFVYPHQNHHMYPKCGCKKEDCSTWSGIRPQDNVHQQLFAKFEELEFTVDSSKNIAWIYELQRKLAADAIPYRSVLIWKTPEQFYASRRKRGLEAGWAEEWVKYHRQFLSVVRPEAVVSYTSLLGDPTALRRICNQLEISYRANKTEYWEKEQHTLFGNSSAKIHLHGKDTNSYQSLESELSRLGDAAEHRSLKTGAELTLPDSMPSARLQEVRKMERKLIELSTVEGAELPTKLMLRDRLHVQGSRLRQRAVSFRRRLARLT